MYYHSMFIYVFLPSLLSSLIYRFLFHIFSFFFFVGFLCITPQLVKETLFSFVSHAHFCSHLLNTNAQVRCSCVFTYEIPMNIRKCHRIECNPSIRKALNSIRCGARNPFIHMYMQLRRRMADNVSEDWNHTYAYLARFC